MKNDGILEPGKTYVWPRSLQSRLAHEAKCIENDVSSRSVHNLLLEASDAIGHYENELKALATGLCGRTHEPLHLGSPCPYCQYDALAAAARKLFEPNGPHCCDCGMGSDWEELKALVSPSPALSDWKSKVCGDVLELVSAGMRFECEAPLGHLGEHRCAQMAWTKNQPQPPCDVCGGSGLVLNVHGEPDDCKCVRRLSSEDTAL